MQAQTTPPEVVGMAETTPQETAAQQREALAAQQRDMQHVPLPDSMEENEIIPGKVYSPVYTPIFPLEFRPPETAVRVSTRRVTQPAKTHKTGVLTCRQSCSWSLGSGTSILKLGTSPTVVGRIWHI